jgi:hypothetical protein
VTFTLIALTHSSRQNSPTAAPVASFEQVSRTHPTMGVTTFAVLCHRLLSELPEDHLFDRLAIKNEPCAYEEVCNVGRIAITIAMFDRWAGSPTVRNNLHRLLGGPASSCRPRCSTGSFIDSFGGKRSMR